MHVFIILFCLSYSPGIWFLWSINFELSLKSVWIHFQFSSSLFVEIWCLLLIIILYKDSLLFHSKIISHFEKGLIRNHFFENVLTMLNSYLHCSHEWVNVVFLSHDNFPKSHFCKWPWSVSLCFWNFSTKS